MQAQVFEGYWEDGKFQPFNNVAHKPGKTRAILTLFEESTFEEIATPKESRVEWLSRLKESIILSMDEDLPDLPPREPMRPPINFED